MLEDMVLKKRQDYGFNGFHAPFVPRAPRSVRKDLHKKRVEDSQICAFELLASLAGKLLQESESSSASSNVLETNDRHTISDGVVKQEQDEERLLKAECPDHGSCEESAFVPEFASPDGDQMCILKKAAHAEHDSILDQSSVITNSDSSEKVNGDLKSVICKSMASGDNLHCKLKAGSPASGKYMDCYVENRLSRHRGADDLETGGLAVDSTSSFKDSMCIKYPALINSDNNVKLPSCRDPVPNTSILRLRNDCKLGIRDYDEKISRYNKPGTKTRAFRHPSRIGERRLRKLLTSKYWKVAPKLKDNELLKVDGGMKPLYHKRKILYGRERYQHDSLCKRKKFSDNSLGVTSGGWFSSESICNSPEKVMNVDKSGSAPMFHGETGVSSSSIGHQASGHSKESHVKFSIKSFRIPELLIEVSENTNVGSLKTTVMETVTAIIGGGLRVGVFINGKKVRDDNRTLSQIGMTSKENLDSLGFTLEPNPVLAPPPVCIEDPPHPLSCDSSQLGQRSPVVAVLDSGISTAAPDPPALPNSIDNTDNDIELITSPTDKLAEKTLSDSRALVVVPPANAEALAVVPINQKARRSELVQRRTRRPFSVSEVEALVQAVEELGTGRWRDVKLRSFENADHRTYVDLKDKWKTLVHTAKIAPQQRRGEQVPQELLDRVLTAHAYWSQHQAKHLSKNQGGVLKITEAHGGRNGVEGDMIMM